MKYKVLDVSDKKRIKNAEHWQAEINQLYHPTGRLKQDSYHIVYSNGNSNTTKFTPILLKEWFYLLEKNGYLIIDYKPNQHLDFKKLEDLMWWLWRKQYQVIFHNEVSPKEKVRTVKDLEIFIMHHENYYSKNLDPKTHLPTPLATKIKAETPNFLRFICKKLVTTQVLNDSITKWTFGIITNGVRLDWIEQIIKSIKAQHIPHYEIILCGRYFDRPEKNIRYIPFNERDDKGWISRKKNLIVDAAQYENICIIHDRLTFDKDWYQGMKDWGNCFEHLCCPQYYESARTNDWLLHEKLPGVEFSFVSHLDFKDWDWNACQGGQFHLLKKSVVQQVYWNESYLWGRAEDVALTNDLRSKGFIIRCNPKSTLNTLVYKFGKIPDVVYDAQRLSSRRVGNIKRVLARKLYTVMNANQHILSTVKKITKNKFIE